MLKFLNKLIRKQASIDITFYSTFSRYQASLTHSYSLPNFKEGDA